MADIEQSTITTRDELATTLRSGEALNLSTVFSFLAQESENYDAPLEDTLVALLADRLESSERNPTKRQLTEQWPLCLGLLGKSSAVSRLLDLTAKWIKSYPLTLNDIRDIGYGPRLLQIDQGRIENDIEKKAAIKNFYNELALKVEDKIKNIGFDPGKDDSREDRVKALTTAVLNCPAGQLSQSLLFPLAIGQLVLATKGLPPSRGMKRFLNAIKVHMDALLIPLGYDPIRGGANDSFPLNNYAIQNADLILRNQIKPEGLLNILWGVEGTEYLPGMLTILCRHVSIPNDMPNLPKVFNSNNLDKLFFSELLNSLKGNFNNPDAQALVSRLRKKTDRNIIPTDINNENVQEIVYELLSSNELFLSNTENLIKINFHELSRSTAKTYAERVLFNIAAYDDNFNGTLQFIYGKGHDPEGMGKMREVIKSVFNNLGITDVEFPDGSLEVDSLGLWHKLANSDALPLNMSLQIVLSGIKHNEPFSIWEKQFKKLLNSEIDLSQLNNESFFILTEALAIARKSFKAEISNDATLRNKFFDLWEKTIDYYNNHLSEDIATSSKKQYWTSLITSVESIKEIPSEKITITIADALTTGQINPNELDLSAIAFLLESFASYPKLTNCKNAISNLLQFISQQYSETNILLNPTHMGSLGTVVTILKDKTKVFEGNIHYRTALGKIRRLESASTALALWQQTNNNVVKSNNEADVYVMPPLLASLLAQIAKENIEPTIPQYLTNEFAEAKKAMDHAEIIVCPLYHIDSNEETPVQLLIFDGREFAEMKYCHQLLPSNKPYTHPLSNEKIIRFLNPIAPQTISDNIRLSILPIGEDSTYTISVADTMNTLVNRLLSNPDYDLSTIVYFADINKNKTDQSFNENDYDLFSLALIDAFQESNNEKISTLIKDARDRIGDLPKGLAVGLQKTPSWRNFIEERYREEINGLVADIDDQIIVLSSGAPTNTHKDNVSPYLEAARIYAEKLRGIKNKQKNSNDIYFHQHPDESVQATFNDLMDTLKRDENLDPHIRDKYKNFSDAMNYRRELKTLEENWNKEITKDWTQTEKDWYAQLVNECLRVNEPIPRSGKELRGVKEKIIKGLRSERMRKIDEYMNETTIALLDNPSHSLVTQDNALAAPPSAQKSSSKFVELIVDDIVEQQLLEKCRNAFKEFLTIVPDRLDENLFDVAMDVKNASQEYFQTTGQLPLLKDVAFLDSLISSGSFHDDELEEELIQQKDDSVFVFEEVLYFDFASLNAETYSEYEHIVRSSLSDIEGFSLDDIFDEEGKWNQTQDSIFSSYPHDEASAIQSLISALSKIRSAGNALDLSGGLIALVEQVENNSDAITNQFLYEAKLEYLTAKVEKLNSVLQFVTARHDWCIARVDVPSLKDQRSALKKKLTLPLRDHFRVMQIMDVFLKRLKEAPTPIAMRAVNDDPTIFDDPIKQYVSDDGKEILESITDFYTRDPHASFGELSLLEAQKAALDNCVTLLAEKGWSAEEEIERDRDNIQKIKTELDSENSEIATEFRELYINHGVDGFHFLSPGTTFELLCSIAIDDKNPASEVDLAREDNTKLLLSELPSSSSVFFFPANLTALNRLSMSDTQHQGNNEWALLVLDNREVNSPKLIDVIFSPDQEIISKKLADGMAMRLTNAGICKDTPKIQPEYGLRRNGQLNETAQINIDDNASLLAPATEADFTHNTALILANCQANTSVIPINNQRAREYSEQQLILKKINSIVGSDTDEDNAVLVDKLLEGDQDAKSKVEIHILNNPDWFAYVVSYMSDSDTVFKSLGDIVDYSPTDDLGYLLYESSVAYVNSINKAFNETNENTRQEKILVANRHWNQSIEKNILNDPENKIALNKLVNALHHFLESEDGRAIDFAQVNSFSLLKESLNQSLGRTSSIMLVQGTLELLSKLPSRETAYIDAVIKLQGQVSEGERALLLARAINAKPSLANRGIVQSLKQVNHFSDGIPEFEDIAKASDIDNDKVAEEIFNDVDSEAQQKLPSSLEAHSKDLEVLVQPFDNDTIQKGDDILGILNSFKEMPDNIKSLSPQQQTRANQLLFRKKLDALQLSSEDRNRVDCMKNFISNHPNTLVHQDLEDLRKAIVKKLKLEIRAIERAVDKLSIEKVNNLSSLSPKQNAILGALKDHASFSVVGALPNEIGKWGVVPLHIETRQILQNRTYQTIEVLLIARGRGDNSFDVHIAPQHLVDSKDFGKLKELLEKEKDIHFSQRRSTDMSFKKATKRDRSTSSSRSYGIQ